MPITPELEKQVEQYKRTRDRGRTDLLFLCNTILKYTDVSREIHGPILDTLQHFSGGEETIVPLPTGNMALTKDSYQPRIPMWRVAPNNYPEETRLLWQRRTLILFPRTHLKTTVATFAHTIQWILNYPDVRILISAATGDQVKKFISEIKSHFEANETFRYYYPEFCPAVNPKTGKLADFGNQEQFTVPNRKKMAKEATVSTCTVGSVIASGHFDVIKDDDIVDKENVRTPDQIRVVAEHFGMMWPLLETSDVRPNTGWRDVIGTRYSFSDLYGSIVDSEDKKPEEQKMWNVCLRSAAPNYPDGPALWEKRMPIRRLREIETDPTAGPDVLYTQYLMNPRPGKSGLVDDKSQIVFIPAKVVDELYPRWTMHCTVDLAGMDQNAKGKDNDYNVVNLHGYGADGCLYIHTLLHVRAITPDEVVQYLFALAEEHPRMLGIKVSKDHFARMLQHNVQRERNRRGKWLNFIPTQIDNSRDAKFQKIKGLQPRFRSEGIKFGQDMHLRAAKLLHGCLGHSGTVFACEQQMCIEAMRADKYAIDEIIFFPKFNHDDILDTCADALVDANGQVIPDSIGRPGAEREGKREWVKQDDGTWMYYGPQAQKMGFDEIFPAAHEEGVVSDITGW